MNNINYIKISEDFLKPTSVENDKDLFSFEDVQNFFIESCENLNIRNSQLRAAGGLYISVKDDSRSALRNFNKFSKKIKIYF